MLQGGGGSGLGLWISKKIVELHGGTVGFSSQGTQLGSTFFIELPLYETGMFDVEMNSVPETANVSRALPSPRMSGILSPIKLHPTGTAIHYLWDKVWLYFLFLCQCMKMSTMRPWYRDKI